MAKFLLVYRSKPYDASEISPEAMQEGMKHWTAWIQEGFAKGWMIDAGDALQPDGKIVDFHKNVTDGPFMEAKEVVGGYSIIQADSYEAAIAYAKVCPALSDPSATVELRQLAELTVS